MEDEELYKIAINTRNMEIGLFWQRSNYFLVLNTAIAVGFFSVKESEYQLALSVLGALVSVLWFLINIGSKYWQSRWEHRASLIETRLGDNIDMFSASKEVTDSDVRASLLNHKKVKQLSLYDRWVMRKPSVSKIMSWLAAIFIALWLSIFVIEVNDKNPNKALNPDAAKSAAPVS